MESNKTPFRAVFEGEELNISSKDVLPQQPIVSYQKPESKLTKFVMMHSAGFLNNEKRVNYFFIGLIIIAITILLFSISTGNGNGTKLEGFPGQ